MQCVHLPHVLALPWESYLRYATEGAFNDSFRTELLMFRLLRSPCHLHSPHALHKDPLLLERAQCMEGIFLLPTLLMYSLIIKLTLCVWLCVNLWIFPMTTGCLLNGIWSVSAFELPFAYSCLLAYVHVSMKWIDLEVSSCVSFRPHYGPLLVFCLCTSVSFFGGELLVQWVIALITDES